MSKKSLFRLLVCVPCLITGAALYVGTLSTGAIMLMACYGAAMPLIAFVAALLVGTVLILYALHDQHEQDIKKVFLVLSLVGIALILPVTPLAFYTQIGEDTILELYKTLHFSWPRGD